MSVWQWVLLGVLLVVAVVVAWQSVQLATRLDRLHWRILSARDSLDRLTARRAVEARLTVSSGVLTGAAGARVDQAALQCLTGEDALFVRDLLDLRRTRLPPVSDDERAVAERNERESALSRVLREELTPEVREHARMSEVSRERVEALDMACYRVRLARSMHNLDVAQVVHLRERTLVRVLHLYGHAPTPATVDFDDGAGDDEAESRS